MTWLEAEKEIAEIARMLVSAYDMQYEKLAFTDKKTPPKCGCRAYIHAQTDSVQADRWEDVIAGLQKQLISPPPEEDEAELAKPVEVI